MREPLALLLCPLCARPFTPSPRTGPGTGALRCPTGHTFDRARHGYVNLLTGNARTGTADTAAMVRARAAFLAAGHYAPLARLLARTAAEAAPADAAVLDAGTGTGYHLAAVLDALPRGSGLGLDVSKFALRRAARAHRRMGAAAWDVWRPLPVRPACADLVLNVFAPRNGPGFHRALRPGGSLLVVTPTARHLAELRDRLGLLAVDSAKDERLARTLSGHFRLTHTEPLEYGLTLTADEAADAAGMGPAARHARQAEGVTELRGALGPGSPVEATASFRVSVFRPRGPRASPPRRPRPRPGGVSA